MHDNISISDRVQSSITDRFRRKGKTSKCAQHLRCNRTKKTPALAVINNPLINTEHTADNIDNRIWMNSSSLLATHASTNSGSLLKQFFCPCAPAACLALR